MDRSLVVRAQEIASRSHERITADEALAAAILERYGDNPKAMAEAFAVAVKWGVRLGTPPPLPKQQGLFPAVPSVISNQTPQGPLLIPRPLANAGEVERYYRFGNRVYRRQAKRFDRALKRHIAAGFDPERNYDEQAAALEAKHAQELELQQTQELEQ